MKRFTWIKIVAGTVFYIALAVLTGTLIYRSGWSSGFMAAGSGDLGAAIISSGSLLAWTIGILITILVGGAILRLVARGIFGMAFMHGHHDRFGRFGPHMGSMYGFGPGFGRHWKASRGCYHRGMPDSEEMEDCFKKWEKFHGEVPEHWRKVAEAAVEARKTDEDSSTDQSN